MHKVQILSAASNLPQSVIKTDDLFEEINCEQQYGIPNDWMSNDMGINERRFADANTSPSELALPAAEKAIKTSGVSPDKIDMIIFCGIERDQPEPATAHTIANKLGINAQKTFDVSNACFGFVDGLQIGCSYISSGVIDHALIVTSEVFSKPVSHLIDKLKKGVSIEKAKKLIGFLSLGDAGGAVVLGRSLNGESGFDLFNTKTLSDQVKRCNYHVNNGEFNGQMDMGPLAAYMVKGHTQIIDETLKLLKWDGFDLLISHQIGKKPFERLSKISGIKDQHSNLKYDNHIKTFNYLGNIASATFPVNFEKLLQHDKVGESKRIGGMFAGSGLVYGQIGYTM
jgi:3-oxoacyl-[acyl-carrier-protein] synthase-3